MGRPLQPLLLLALPSLLLVVLLAGAPGQVNTAQQGAHQERGNRIKPDFKSFDHPSQKAVGGAPSRHAGPIAQLEWVEGRGHGEGGVPVFGHIHPPPPASSSSSSPLLILLLLGGVGAAVFLRAKTPPSSPPKEAQEEASSQQARRGTREPSPPRQKTAQKESSPPPPPCPPVTRNSTPPPPSPVKEKAKEAVLPPAPVPASPPAPVPAPASAPSVIITPPDQEIDSKSAIKTNPTDERIGDEAEEKAAIKAVDVNGNVTEVEEIDNKPEPPVIRKSEISKNPANKRLEEGRINASAEEEVEEPEFITKIKTFKITKWPKTNNADLVQHGPDSLLSVLEAVQLQKLVEFRTEIPKVKAELNIEGANTSRLLITLIEEKDEEESVSKTMTIREYMVSISNKIIEEAVKAVREDCSMDNIRHLADTIKKYRPESAEIKNVRKL